MRELTEPSVYGNGNVIQCHRDSVAAATPRKNNNDCATTAVAVLCGRDGPPVWRRITAFGRKICSWTCSVFLSPFFFVSRVSSAPTIVWFSFCFSTTLDKSHDRVLSRPVIIGWTAIRPEDTTSQVQHMTFNIKTSIVKQPRLFCRSLLLATRSATFRLAFGQTACLAHPNTPPTKSYS